jgi:hypothetical protein
MNRFAILGVSVAVLALAGVCFVAFVPQPPKPLDRLMINELATIATLKNI